MRRGRSQGGVTLIELMVVVVIVAVLAAIAVPSYRSYVQRTQRTDATAALLKLAAAQEKFYLQNLRYATNAQLAPGPPVGLGLAGTENGWYTLQITAADAAGFTAQATPAPGSPQQADARCQTFTINDRGARTSAPGPVDTCWR